MTNDITSVSKDDWATYFAAHRIDEANVERFARWSDEANEQLLNTPGFLGIDTIRADDEQSPRFITLIKFDTTHHRDAWINSADHQSLLADIEPLFTESQRHRAEGLEMWFTIPPANRPANPGYWRQILVVAPAVYGLVIGLGELLAPITGDLPTRLAIGINTVFVTMLLTWPVMPWISKIFAPFLYPNSD